MKNPLHIWQSALVGAQILTAGAALTDVIGAQAAAFSVLAVAALQGATQFYVNGQVAAVASGGQFVAGPASTISNGQPVAVIPTPADPVDDTRS